MSLRLIGLQVKDFQKIQLIDLQFDPNSNSISVGGDNEQGKSALLNSIYAALVKTPNSVQTPIRDGCDNAFVRLTLGDCSSGASPAYRIDRKYESTDSGKVLSELKVTDLRSLEKISNPAAFVSRLLGDTILDVTHFIDGLTPAQQRALVCKIVGVDTDEIDAEIKKYQDNDTALRRVQTAAEEHASRAPRYPEVHDVSEVQASDIVEELRLAVEHNQSIESMKSRRIELFNRSSELQSKIDLLEAELATLRSTLTSCQEAIAQTDSEIASKHVKDVQSIRDRLADIESLNDKIRANAAHAAARERWMAAEEDTNNNLKLLDAAKTKRRELLANAKMPVEGLTIGHTYLEYNGHPLSDESRARQIVIAVAIALSSDSDLKLILVPDAAVIKPRLMQDIITMCAARGAQVVVEMASEQHCGSWVPKTDIVINDGSVIAEIVGVPDGES